MANPNALIVEVVGDTTKLKAGLQSAEQDLNRFAGRASSWDARAAARAEKQSKLDAERAARAEANTAAEEAAAKAADANAVSTARFAAKATIAGAATYALIQNLQELGGTAGKVGTAFGQLLTGNVVGFVKTLQDNSAEISKFEQDLLDSGDAAKAGKAAYELAAAGLDDLAAAALNASQKLQAANDRFVDATKIRDSTSPGVIAGEVSGIPLPKPRRGITVEQRNTFFDNAIARELERAQDNVATLEKIKAEIEKRIKATDDVTRTLNLEDQALAVQRRIESIQTAAAKESARLAKERAAAEKERLANLREATLARQQSRDDLLLGLQTPGVPNLRKQLAQLTGRTDIGSIPNKLAAALEGARKILNRSWDTISEESRSNIAALFDTIRQALNEGATGGPLTKTTQLSENILKGLGLDAAQTRVLKARLSHFNSAGTALTGTTTTAPLTTVSNTVIDGKVVATTSSKYRRRGSAVNTTQRTGPNAGTVVS